MFKNIFAIVIVLVLALASNCYDHEFILNRPGLIGGGFHRPGLIGGGFHRPGLIGGGLHRPGLIGGGIHRPGLIGSGFHRPGLGGSRFFWLLNHIMFVVFWVWGLGGNREVSYWILRGFGGGRLGEVGEGENGRWEGELRY